MYELHAKCVILGRSAPVWRNTCTLLQCGQLTMYTDQWPACSPSQLGFFLRFYVMHFAFEGLGGVRVRVSGSHVQ